MGKTKNDVHSTSNEQHAKHNMPFDFKEAKKSNILISGTNQQGKSLCAMAISDLLMRYVKSPWQVIVFDNVGHWKDKSSLPIFYKVSETTMSYILPEHSIIYDISLLLPSYQKEFAEMVLNDLWKKKIEGKSQRWTMIVFEEFQLYAKNVRGNVSQNILRIMSVGANHKIRCLGITPDLSLIDCAFIRLTNQRYHFRLGNEPNAKRRFNAYYGKDYTRVVQELDVGFCLYYLNEKLKIWKIPEFISYRKPQEYTEPKPKPKPTLTEKILKVFSGGIYNSEEFDREQEENDLREIEEEFPEEW
jgi:hypothetical protein